ncbi:MAG TPA: L,D-transpeptidase [Longimicrobiales bacterium]|nr:L,D-transpeptidase [Longimicrobiales bacterium]
MRSIISGNRGVGVVRAGRFVATALGLPALAVATLVLGTERAAAQSSEIRVSLDEKRLAYVSSSGDTLLSAPIAIGRGGLWELNGTVYDFRTPKGTRTVLAKNEDPDWIPPDWHYYERSVQRGLEPVQLKNGDRFELSDNSIIEVRDGVVGRRVWIFDGTEWRHSDFNPISLGFDIVGDGRLFIPPLDSPQRRVPNALGPVKLVLGDGYLIHGTHDYNENSIGLAASHGCIRMSNADVEQLFKIVPVGTPVRIF